ncbi:MAG: putative apolipoprotein N-acyltransferase N-acyltransferase, rane protein [Pseudomonadota bacterium]|jgi:apolipoprotein N-acyltransferase
MLLVLIAGAAQAVSIATPWNGQPLWWLQLLSLAALAGLLPGQTSARRAAVLGALFATAWLAGTWWWLFISMHVYGGLAAPLAVVAVLLLASALGLYYALASAIAWWLGRRSEVRGVLAFGAAWLLAELMRGVWFTGFPWGAGGYAHVQGPLTALAPWVGVYGIGFLAAVAAGLLATVARSLTASGREALGDLPHATRSPWFWVACGLWCVCVGAAHVLPAGDSRPTGAPLSVALLQGNIPQNEKFQAGSGIPQAIEGYARALRESGASLIVAPETAIPLLPAQLPAGYLETIGAHLAGRQQAALVGIPLGSYAEGYTNSVIGLGAAGVPYRYDKYHLVPFGEFIPPLFRWFTDLMQIPLGDFNRGRVDQASFAWRGQQLAPNVCYEDLFGEELARRFADPARAPTVLVNVSNIAWFGNSVAIDQHLQISRMRALELQRPMIRATNTGATALIDAQGQVQTMLPRHTRGVLEGKVQGHTGRTPFARWASAWGLGPLWGLAIAILLIAIALESRSRRA